jgi:hypothetical protein
VDSHNLFATKTTYRLLRLEYAAALVSAAVLVIMHLDHVRWWAFAALFVYIDVIGYLPGAIAWRRSPDGRISRVYYVLYNTAHSLLSAAAVAAVWALVAGPEWALLALPLHLFGDRAIFGNFMKPFGLSFEPRVHPAYQEFVTRYEQSVRRQPDVVEHVPLRAA